MKVYMGVTKSFRTGRLERELQMVQLSAIRCSCIAVLWMSLVSSAAITLCVSSQRVFIVVYFVIDSVRKLLDTSSYRGCVSKDTRILGLHISRNLTTAVHLWTVTFLLTCFESRNIFIIIFLQVIGQRPVPVQKFNFWTYESIWTVSRTL
jgi:hypothetical protein